MLKFAFLLSIILALSISGCALFEGEQTPQLTPLEIQSLQTREYQASKERVFASVVSSFQDQGYTILSADQPSGLIIAKSLLQSGTHYTATAFLETIGQSTRVRLSFVKKVTGSRWDSGTIMYHHKDGHMEKYKFERQVLDATLYQNAFERIESNLFVHSNF